MYIYIIIKCRFQIELKKKQKIIFFKSKLALYNLKIRKKIIPSNLLELSIYNYNLKNKKFKQ